MTLSALRWSVSANYTVSNSLKGTGRLILKFNRGVQYMGGGGIALGVCMKMIEHAQSKAKPVYGTRCMLDFYYKIGRFA